MHKCFSVLSYSVPVLGWNTPSTSGKTPARHLLSHKWLKEATVLLLSVAFPPYPPPPCRFKSWGESCGEHLGSALVTGQNGWAEWDAEVVLKREAVSGGGASTQTGNTLEWRSVASFHKQHHRRVPDIYDLWSEWQHRPDSDPSLRVCPVLTWLNLPDLLSYFPIRWKHQTFHMVGGEVCLKQVIWEHYTWTRTGKGRGHHGKGT